MSDLENKDCFKEAKEEFEDDDCLYMDEDEFAGLEICRLKEENIKLRQQIGRLKVELLKKDLSLYSKMAMLTQHDIEKSNTDSLSLVDELSKVKEEREAILGSVRERLGIEGRFGVDPESLEIVID